MHLHLKPSKAEGITLLCHTMPLLLSPSARGHKQAKRSWGKCCAPSCTHTHTHMQRKQLPVNCNSTNLHVQIYKWQFECQIFILFECIVWHLHHRTAICPLLLKTMALIIGIYFRVVTQAILKYWLRQRQEINGRLMTLWATNDNSVLSHLHITSVRALSHISMSLTDCNNTKACVRQLKPCRLDRISVWKQHVLCPVPHICLSEDQG